MRNVKIIVFKTVFLIELLPAVHCRYVKVYCKMLFIALGKTVLGGGGGTKYACVNFFFDDTISAMHIETNGN